MQIMGNTEAGNTSFAVQSLEELIPKAQSDIGGKSMTGAISYIENQLVGLKITLSMIKNRGPEGFTSLTVQGVLNRHAYCLALISVLMDQYSPSGAQMSKIDSLLTGIEKSWNVLKQWDSSVADALIQLSHEKQRAVESGNLDSPVLTNEERAYYVNLAKTGSLDYQATALNISEEAAERIANYTPTKAGLSPMTLGIGAAAALAGLYFMTR